MANKYINIYAGNPTSGGTDGTQVSTDGANTSPIAATLDASKAESAKIKCAIRCETGYHVVGDVTLAPTGTNAAKWSVAYDSTATADTAPDDGKFGASATIPNVAAANVIFWVKATSSADEDPANDTTVKIQAQGKIGKA